jgi:hypothetical protein
MFAVVGAALAGVARAQEAANLAGEWRVEGTPEVRRVEVRPAGRARLELIAGDRGPARVEGPSAATPLVLEGTIVPAAGLVGALTGREAGAAARVRVTVVRERATPLGEEVARAHVSVDGRQVATERWTRPGAPRLELVALEGFGAGGFDPTRERCDVRVRVLGCAQHVTLRALVPPRAQDGRVEHYQDEGVDPQRVTTVGPVRLAPGEHTLRWEGRDDGPAGRLALPGRWTLTLQSDERAVHERAPVTATVTVARPWLQCVEPRFDRASPFPLDALDRLRTDFSTRYALAGTRTQVDEGPFLAALGRAAVGVVVTHGHDSMLSLGDWKRPEPLITPGDLRGKPLRDVHAVLLFSCRSGQDDGRGDDLATAFVRAGVDVVVLSTETLLIAEARPYHDAIGARLLGYGHPISRAALDAAKFSYERVWEPVSERRRAAWLAHPERIRPLKDALRVVTAPGVDPAEESLVPARYGRATN